VHTDTLRYDVPDALVSTKSDVRIDFAQHTLTAHGLDANLKERTMRLRIESEWPLPPLKRSLGSRSHCRPRKPSPRTRSSKPSRSTPSPPSWITRTTICFFTRCASRKAVCRSPPDQAQATGLDFENSHWVFRGNVKITMVDQGQLTSDEAEITFVKKLLSKAIVNGNPAVFEQRLAKTGKLAHGRAGVHRLRRGEKEGGAFVQECLVE